MIKLLFVLIFLLSEGFAQPFDECFNQASNTYKVPKELLIAIASVESKFNPLAINYNKNGSYDIGIMQINSYWFSQLNAIGISEASLKQPCQNIMVGTWILAKSIKSTGFNWNAIQHYNGSDPQLSYAKKVYFELKRLNPELVNSQIIFNSDYSESQQLTNSNVNKLDISQNLLLPKSHFLYVN